MIAILAHIGHGSTGFSSGILHPLLGIDHLLAMVAVGVLAAVATDRRLAWATPAAFVAGMVGGGMLGVAGIGAGFIESTIQASIVVLGGLIAASVVPSFRTGAWVPVMALAFGGIHGIAHGGEVPGSVSPAAYVLGFVTATVVLHLAGVFIGSTFGRSAGVRMAFAGSLSAAGLAILAGAPI